jgi:hypothetical protein
VTDEKQKLFVTIEVASKKAGRKLAADLATRHDVVRFDMEPLDEKPKSPYDAREHQ